MNAIMEIVGRILVHAILSGTGFDEVRYFNLSEQLYHRKAEYFEMLGLTQKGGRYSIWIDFFVAPDRSMRTPSLKVTFTSNRGHQLPSTNSGAGTGAGMSGT